MPFKFVRSIPGPAAWVLAGLPKADAWILRIQEIEAALPHAKRAAGQRCAVYVGDTPLDEYSALRAEYSSLVAIATLWRLGELVVVPEDER